MSRVANITDTIQGVLRYAGLQVVRLSPPGTLEYQTASPIATYAPWNLDTEFRSTYNSVKSHTLVDLYRCWELWTLAAQSAKRPGAILEIGVWRGGTGALLAKKSSSLGCPDPVYLCDTFEGVVKATSQDNQYKGGEHSDTSQQVVENLLQSLGVKNARLLKGVFPDDTAHLIEPGARFRLCHIDVDVYQSAKDVIAWVWSRMVDGGIVVYDDYGMRGCAGITKYVNEQLADKDRLVLHNLNGHAIVVKLPAIEDRRA